MDFRQRDVENAEACQRICQYEEPFLRSPENKQRAVTDTVKHCAFFFWFEEDKSCAFGPRKIQMNDETGYTSGPKFCNGISICYFKVMLYYIYIFNF